MEKKYFFLRLNPIRADFTQTMSDAERAIMQQHAAYWRAFMEQGKIVVFGPVNDPNGAFGIGVARVDEEDEIKQFIAGDPALTLSTIDYFPMRAVTPA